PRAVPQCPNSVCPSSLLLKTLIPIRSTTPSPNISSIWFGNLWLEKRLQFILSNPQQKTRFPGPEASKLCAARRSHKLFTSGAGGAKTPTSPATSPTSPTSTGHRSTAVPRPPLPPTLR
ncbi:hypothetical protein B0H14DRAFT_3151331, partial [Mycena olivaceomarginata]